MRVRVSTLVVASAVVWTSCASPSGESPAGVVAPAPLARTGAAVLEDCSATPPPLLTPADGAVLSGSVVISAPLLEGPCFITATVVFEVVNAAGTVVFVRCDNDLPAHVTWDTTTAKNGHYTIRAHRACSCNACAPYSSIAVTVANPG